MKKRIGIALILLVEAGSIQAGPPTIGACPVLPADNIWNTPVDQLPLAANSATYVATIGSGTSLKADFGSGTYNGGPIGIPFVTVPGTQTKYPATFTYADESDAGPYAVPLNAPIEGGSQSNGDRHAISVDIDNCLLYELYGAYPQTSSWQAGSGAIFNFFSNALRPSGWTSADAAGLPIVPGLVRYDEVAAGEIRHAIRLTVPQTRRAFVWPARHYASSLTDPKYPAMGQRFRLRASFDISSFSTENQVILKALKKYGMMLADNGSAWFITGAPDSRWNNTALSDLRRVVGSDFEAVDVSSLMIDPNSGQARQTSIAVTVSPSTANLMTSATQQFTATVQNSANQSVTWSVNGTLGGNGTVGYIDTVGLYSAPSTAPNPPTVTVAATSVAAPGVSGSASVTIQGPSVVTVNLTPATASVRVRKTQQFTATVQGTTNTSVTWKVDGIQGGDSTLGTISASGLYTAPGSVPSPATVTVSATSVASPSASASATVTIKRR
ncbi:MAG TPA: hypothetical protein VL285_15975 [Bryobacteraceae bacterium]|nr:hypothetical protein [Bryobacteraceae bacterium]